MVQASVGFHCPECVKSSPQVQAHRAERRAGTPYATYTLIALNVAVFVLDVASGADPMGGGALGEVGIRGALVGASRGEGFELVGVAFGEWWRVVTGGFLHAGILHLALNMYALWILGSQLEHVLGRARFVALYGTSLLAGAFAVLLLDPTDWTVGASGAIFGMFGVAFVFQRSAGIDPWRSGVGALILINLVFTFTIPGISVGGHIGGLIGGALTALLIFEIEERTKSTAAALAICGVIAAALFAGSLWAAAQWANPILG